MQRRAEKHDHTRSIPLACLERLWEHRNIDLCERTLWRLLYETAARADEVVRLDEDLAPKGCPSRARRSATSTGCLMAESATAAHPRRPVATRTPNYISTARGPTHDRPWPS